DFSGYRKPTLLRRIQRRMSLVALTQLTDYAAVLREDPAEVASLANDLMINVTGFFRDPEAWEALRTAVIGPLCAARLNGGEPIRAWVTACASGEEAYSLAILIAEEARARGIERPEVKIFATDTADKSLSLARAGVFPGGIEADMSPERLERFFDRDDHTFRVKKEIRDMVVFAPQDVLRDPPFSRVDLCTCRNLLIYLEPETQRRVISLLHFALRDGGYMFLGTTETFGGSEHLFEVISKKWRIYRRTGMAQQRFSDVPSFAVRMPGSTGLSLETAASNTRPSATLLLQRALLERYGPPTVVVDRSDQVVYFHGLTDPFLQHPAGEPTRDIIQLVKPWLRLSVRTALRNAMRESRVFTTECEIAEDGGTRRTLRVTSEPVLQGRSPEYFLVSFQFVTALADTASDSARLVSPLTGADSQADGAAFDEIQTLRRELQNTIEAFEATSEELKASNEEATSINEELQSTNEELETGKEELQSVNEELTTVNSQLQTKIAQLEATTNDLSNLLGSTDIGVVFLDADFRVRRFTPAVSDLLELIDSDVGRPITDLAPKFTDDHLLQDAREVLLRLIPIERVIRSHSGRYYLRRTLPYRTAENRIEGVVITFVDVGARKGTEQEIMNAHLRVQDVLDRLPMSILIIDALDGGGVLFANDRARELFGGRIPKAAPSGGRVIMPRFEAAGRDGKPLQAEDWPLARALSSGTTVTDEIRLPSVAGKNVTLHVTAAPVRDGSNAVAAVVGIFSEANADAVAGIDSAPQSPQSGS
ncbi:MAG: PAS domain-containing protein, partial [Sinobacteraceae bacterium]|nr:PAS domain-containing protein [Nevskiaceae bacterium]